jgi:hypothetical protein
VGGLLRLRVLRTLLCDLLFDFFVQFLLARVGFCPAREFGLRPLDLRAGVELAAESFPEGADLTMFEVGDELLLHFVKGQSPGGVDAGEFDDVVSIARFDDVADLVDLRHRKGRVAEGVVGGREDDAARGPAAVAALRAG